LGEITVCSDIRERFGVTTESDRLNADYRIRVINTGLIISWWALGLFSVWALSLDPELRTSGLIVAGGIFMALVVLTITPWRKTLASPVADWLIVAWSLCAFVALVFVTTSGGNDVSAIGFLLVSFVAAAAAMKTLPLVIINVGAVICYSFSLGESNGFSTSATATRMLAFVAATIIVVLLSIRIRTQIEESAADYEQLATRESTLAGQERRLSQLYDVSLSIGAGTELDKVLPELTGHVVESVGARIGLVLLYNADAVGLELMTPIWVAGHTVATEDFMLPLDERGLPQRVFTSGDPAMVNSFEDRQSDDRLAHELQADRVAAVALRLGDRTIGVLLVGDKASDFTDEDLRTLESVAAPAALVLNQLTRYEQVRASSVRMTEVAEMKTNFVSVVSHELRTPLTSIIGALSTLQRPELLPEDPRAQQLITMASNQSRRLHTLIEDLLVMSRIEAASLPIRSTQIDIEAFVKELLGGLPNAEDVAIVVSEDASVLWADRDHLSRILTNLVENAIKYGDDADITVEASTARADVRISVIDHGPGIPYQMHDVIFDRFTQLQPHATRSRGGAGLGLSIVRGLAEAMNGRVWFEPTVDGGATFTVTLPAEPPEDHGSGG
jgi:signal transduction histidine kinase